VKNDKITVRFRVPKGKKNNNYIFKGRFVTNSKARKDEKDLAEAIRLEAINAGWDIPFDNYMSMTLEYDCLIDEICVTITKLDSFPSATKWGGKIDIQNILDTVADAIEDNKRHSGISVNDNRLCEILVKRSPILKKIKKKKT